MTEGHGREQTFALAGITRYLSPSPLRRCQRQRVKPRQGALARVVRRGPKSHSLERRKWNGPSLPTRWHDCPCRRYRGTYRITPGTDNWHSKVTGDESNVISTEQPWNLRLNVTPRYKDRGREIGVNLPRLARPLYAGNHETLRGEGDHRNEGRGVSCHAPEDLERNDADSPKIDVQV